MCHSSRAPPIAELQRNEARTTEARHQDDIMPHQFSLAQTVRKPAVTSKGGIVASQSRRAAEVGAQVLAAGGDCVDAIVATTFALERAGALEQRHRRRRRDGALPRRGKSLRGDRLRHVRAAEPARRPTIRSAAKARPPICFPGRG